MVGLTLNDLHNPNNITGILLKNNDFIQADINQGFQEYPKSIELWEKLTDGRLLRVRRWLEKSIIATYK